jgi:hypothetical protein
LPGGLHAQGTRGFRLKQGFRPKTVSFRYPMTPDCSRANPVRFGSRFENDATRLRAGPFDTGRTRPAATLDGAELRTRLLRTIVFAQQVTSA